MPRDITPSTIILADTGEVLLESFLLADVLSRVESENILHYIAPELANGESYDLRTDIYSLGVILFELVTGHPINAGIDMSESLIIALDPERAGVAERLRNIDNGLARIIGIAVSRQPSQRFVSPQEFADSLAEYLNMVNAVFTKRDLSVVVSGIFECEH